MGLVEGKVCLVTGAGSGIGKSIAEVLAAEGGKVACLDLKDAEKTASNIVESGFEASGYIIDVSDADAWHELVKKIISDYGKIDVLVNNAGISTDTFIVDLTEESFDNILSVNLKGPFLGMREVLPKFIEQKSGKIINIASLAAHIGITQLPSYSATKGGLISMSRQVAVEYADKNIQVNVVSPGIIETPILANNPEGVSDQHLENTPANRLGKPEEIANAVLYFASDSSGFTTGQTLKVDGGWGSH